MYDFEKYIDDERFIQWVFEPTKELDDFFARYFLGHPDKKEEILKMKQTFALLSVKNEVPDLHKREQIYKAILANIKTEKSSKRNITHLVVRIGRYAAVALLFFAIGGMLMLWKSNNPKELQAVEELFLKNAVVNPTIYLSDGSQKAIPDNTLVDFLQEGKVVIGTDTLFIGPEKYKGQDRELIVVPFGKKAKIRLSDNSIVWLNAGSRLIFPGSFDKRKREVYLVGEGYFNVAKDKRRLFLVETSSIKVKVLGTRFNISAYPDNSYVTAVLEEGHIQLCGNSDLLFENWIDLSPNQKATFDKNSNQISVAKTNHELYTLWKDGIIKFENEPVSQLIEKVERYFNISIKLADPNKGIERISGKLDLKNDKNEVLEYIEKLTHGKITESSNGEYVLN